MIAEFCADKDTLRVIGALHLVLGMPICSGGIVRGSSRLSREYLYTQMLE
jgi:hypothetical protein